MGTTFQEANDLLSGGQITNVEVLKQFPFGDFLHSLWSSKDGGGEEYQSHGHKVLWAMNKLLSSEPEALMGARVDEASKKLLRRTQEEIEAYVGGFENTGALFRVAALYHDIGKYIIRERHPTVGWYTMAYLNPAQKDALRTLVGNNEDYLQLLMIMIRDHDLFGVLSTGEASYPILLRTATSLGSAVEDEKRTVSAIMWLNLADIAGTAGIDLHKEDLIKIIDDWKWFIRAIEKCADKNQRLDDYVIREASSGDLVDERISRLLLEASRQEPNRLKELRAKNLPMFIQDKLDTVYPTQNPRREFNYQFTLVCKLDYAKRFLATLVDYCEGPRDADDASHRHRSEKREELDDLIYAVLAILRRITSTYLAMMQSESGPGNLIGVEMKDLTPSTAPEKTTRMIKMLLKNHYPGLSWLMSDCLAWYF